MTVFNQLLNDYKHCLIRGDHSDGAAAYLALVDEYEQAARRAPAAPVPQIADVQDSLVAISAAIANQDDSAAQSMLRDLLSMLAAAPQPPDAAPVELPEHMTSEHSSTICGAATKVDPIAWYVTGCSTMLDEHDAKAEAKRCGGCAQAVPLYTEQQVRELLEAHGIGKDKA